MHALYLIALALPLAYAAPAAAPSAAPAAIKPIFGSWGGSVKPFKAGKVGDKWNPTPAPPPQAPMPSMKPLPSPKPSPNLPPPPDLNNPFRSEPSLGETKNSNFDNDSRNAKESSQRSDITRMNASNSVALFNGIPVDPHTGLPINPPELEEESEESMRLQKRGMLKKKLGLNFLNDPNVTDEEVREHLKSADIGMGLAAPKGQFLPPPPPQKGPAMEHTAGPIEPENIPPAPAAQSPPQPEQPKSEQKRPWNGGSYMVYNGVPMPVEGDVTNKALDMSKFAPPGPRGLVKRGDVRSKLGLGMFDVPGVSGRRKAPAPIFEEEEEEEEYEGTAEVEEAASAAIDKAAPVQPELKAPARAPEALPSREDGLRELDLQDLGKSFVIYNGLPVEINGSPVNNVRLKKPRPAFRGNRGSNDGFAKLSKREAGAEAGRKYAGLNPFISNPITSGGTKPKGPSNKNSENNPEKNATKGSTNSDTVKNCEYGGQSPRTSEEEVINIKKGNNYVLFNGQPMAVMDGMGMGGGMNPFDGMRDSKP